MRNRSLVSIIEAGSLLEDGVNENIEYDSILGYQYSICIRTSKSKTDRQ